MTYEHFRIGPHVVGQGRCFIIGEIAQAHDGSLGMAHAYIDAIARAGADAVKFQTHIADAESSPQEPWRVKFSRQDATRFDYWKRMEFTREQWVGLKEHAEEKGLVFLSSPFSLQAAELLDALGMVAWKVASGEINNHALLDRMAATSKPVLLSSEAMAETRISGAEVPMPTMVRPMIRGDMPQLRAAAAAPLTNRPAPHASKRSPATTAIEDCNMDDLPLWGAIMPDSRTARHRRIPSLENPSPASAGPATGKPGLPLPCLLSRLPPPIMPAPPAPREGPGRPGVSQACAGGAWLHNADAVIQ